MENEEVRLLATDYNPSTEDVEEVLRYVRLETARHAKIDPERIGLAITKYTAVTGKSFGEGYWRPDGGEMTVDGGEPDKKQRWWCAQVMMATRRKLDPARRGAVTSRM